MFGEFKAVSGGGIKIRSLKMLYDEGLDRMLLSGDGRRGALGWAAWVA